MIHKERIRILRQAKLFKGTVVYWMSRDQRLDNNWALFYAQELAIELESPLIVLFCLVPEFLNATLTGTWTVERAVMDIDDASVKLEKLYRDRELCLKYGKIGRKKVMEYYTWDVVNQQWKNLLKKHYS